jgi:hypothetical protein
MVDSRERLQCIQQSYFDYIGLLNTSLVSLRISYSDNAKHIRFMYSWPDNHIKNMLCIIWPESTPQFWDNEASLGKLLGGGFSREASNRSSPHTPICYFNQLFYEVHFCCSIADSADVPNIVWAKWTGHYCQGKSHDISGLEITVFTTACCQSQSNPAVILADCGAVLIFNTTRQAPVPPRVLGQRVSTPWHVEKLHKIKPSKGTLVSGQWAFKWFQWWRVENR